MAGSVGAPCSAIRTADVVAPTPGVSGSPCQNHEVLGVAALHHVLAAPVPVRPHRAPGGAVVARIAVEDQRAGAGLLRRVGLDGAVATSIPRQGDASLQRHAELLQFLVVGRQAVVDVDDRSGCRARCRVGDVAALEFGMRRGGVLGDRRLGDAELPAGRRRHRDGNRRGRREQHLVLVRGYVQPEAGERVLQIADDLARARRSGRMGTPRERRVQGGHRVGRYQRAEARLQLLLSGRGTGGVAEFGPRRRRGCWRFWGAARAEGRRHRHERDRTEPRPRPDRKGAEPRPRADGKGAEPRPRPDGEGAEPRPRHPPDGA